MLYSDFMYPSEKATYDNINELIECLLTKNVGKRCCQTSLIKELKLFEGFEWDKLIDMKLPAPFIPSYCDQSSLLEGSIQFEKAIELHESPELDDTACEKSQENSIEHIEKNWEEEF